MAETPIVEPRWVKITCQEREDAMNGGTVVQRHVTPWTPTGDQP